MSVFLLYHGLTSSTGRELARAMGVESGEVCRNRIETLIRWGSRGAVGYRPTGGVINSRAAIQKASDKRAALEFMRGAGVNVPKGMCIDDARYRWFQWNTGPLVGRPIQHQGGSGFHLCLNSADVVRAVNNGAEYFTEYVPNGEEWRAHIVGGQMVMAQLKCAEPVVSNEYCRNRENGWALNRRPAPGWVESIGVQAIRALGLDFGAVDMCKGNNGQSYVLEVNSAPGLEGDKLMVYARALAGMVGVEIGGVEGEEDDNTSL